VLTAKLIAINGLVGPYGPMSMSLHTYPSEHCSPHRSQVQQFAPECLGSKDVDGQSKQLEPKIQMRSQPGQDKKPARSSVQSSQDISRCLCMAYQLVKLVVYA